MTLIITKNLGVTLGASLFANLNLTIHAGDRLGIVAANGRGKSTLLRCLTGAFEPTTGDVTRSRGLIVGHVEQDVPASLMPVSLRDAVVQALPPEQIDSESWRADVVLDMLNVPLALNDLPLSALSGGWQRIALLARVWVRDPDMLLMDEPTNHLDLARIAELEDWLNALPRDFPVVICSHDRAFLDATTNRTLFLRPEKSPVFALPYTKARAALDLADEADGRQFDRDMKAAQQLRQQAAKLKNIGINSGSDLLVTKTKQLKERAEKLEASAKPAHLERSAGSIQLANRGTHAKNMLVLDAMTVSAPDGTLLFKAQPMFVSQGDRIVLLGANGTGKTRLVSLIRAAIDAAPSTDAPIRATPSLVMAYGDQTLADLDLTETPMQALTRRFAQGEQRARGLLAGAGMTVEMQTRPIARLSGGQKARLSMLFLRLKDPNFYLLDEPTNHLDIDGQEALEDELLTHQATCLIVSHDRSFIRAVGNRFWLIEKKKLTEVDGPEGFFAGVRGQG